MPTVLRVHGHRFFFFSNEGREQPHIHIATAEKYAKFWLNQSLWIGLSGIMSAK